MSDGCAVCDATPGNRTRVTIPGLGKQIDVEMCDRCFENFPEDETIDATHHGAEHTETATYRIAETAPAEEPSANKYTSLLQQAPNAVFLADPETTIISEANNRAADLTGYDRSELEGMSVLDLHPPADRDRYAELFGVVLSGGSRDRFTDGTPLYLRRADGTDCPIEMSVSVADIDGKELVQGIIRDISPRREREQTLKRKQQFLNQIQDVADVGGWEINLPTNSLRWTDEVYRIHGVDNDFSLTIENVIELYHPEDQAVIEDAVERATTEGEPYDKTVRILRPDGEVRWTRARGKPWYEDDEIVGVRGTFQDITDHKERERDLRMKSQALEESPVGITIADATQPDEPIIYANEGFSTLTGYSRERVLDNNCRFLQGEGTDDAKVAEIRSALNAERSIRTEILNYRVDGTPFWNKLTISPVTGKDAEDVTHYVGIQEDVTVKKRRDRLIEVLNRVLRHNLRNDINAIQGFARVIATRTDDETAQMAQRISEKAGELSALSEKAQDFQTAVRDAEPLAPRDVVADVEATVTELQAEFPETEFTIEVEACEDVMATERLRLALRELGANAAQHGDCSTITYRVEMTDEAQLAISIRDSGPGLPEVERNVLEAGRETALEHGSGLGLWLVNWIVTELGGEVTTTVDDGTTVTIHLSPAIAGAVPEHREAALSTRSK